MRAICKVCKDKDKCSHLASNRTSDCIDVQTSDYGYEEAVEKACEWLKQCTTFQHPDYRHPVPFFDEEDIEDFRKTMEEQL